MSIVLALTSISCGGGGGSGTSTSAPSAGTVPSATSPDLQIAQQVYAGTTRVPAGFYREELPTSYSHVSTEHLKNADIAAVASGHPVYELCTDDWNEALAWSELEQQRSAQYAALVATNDDPRFHEFGRVRSGEPQFYLRERVFKCGYLDRHDSNLLAREGIAGQLRALPVDAAGLRRLSEYLWQFTAFNNFGTVVLATQDASTATGLRYTISMATLHHGSVSTSCDRIELVDWTHEVDTTTGALSRSVRTVRSFGARESSGAIELCSV